MKNAKFRLTVVIGLWVLLLIAVVFVLFSSGTNVPSLVSLSPDTTSPKEDTPEGYAIFELSDAVYGNGELPRGLITVEGYFFPLRKESEDHNPLCAIAGYLVAENDVLALDTTPYALEGEKLLQFLNNVPKVPVSVTSRVDPVEMGKYEGRFFDSALDECKGGEKLFVATRVLEKIEAEIPGFSESQQVASGAVVIDGFYTAPPYSVVLDGYDVLVNGSFATESLPSGRENALRQKKLFEKIAATLQEGGSILFGGNGPGHYLVFSQKRLTEEDRGKVFDVIMDQSLTPDAQRKKLEDLFGVSLPPQAIEDLRLGWIGDGTSKK
ncbi:hypothetical protein D6779_10260 [Candidatus Parcubacteria bacterium]|nr:MAG: hypothetical protein D6779_10260 [Candidatus Parcubacteria bacterium]